LGGIHALVDAASGFIVFRDVGSGELDGSTVLGLVVLYNSLAFGGQAIAGLAADAWRSYRAMAMVGAALQGVALLVASASTLAGVILVGIGNALFHVGAGAYVLKSSGRRSTESGVFVGPGAIGLAAGILAGGHDVPIRLALALALLASTPLLALLARDGERAEKVTLPAIKSQAALLGVVCVGCLLGSITVRAMVGGAVAGTWRGVSVWVMVLLAVAACGGKMLGGFVSDRLGWATTSVAALLLSLPLVSYFVDVAACAVVGMLLFQMTMPVTLKAVHHLLPERPGLAFGIPCVALLAGALPGIYGTRVLNSWPLVIQAVVLSTMLVALGLHLLVRVGASEGPGRELAGRLVGK
jgi:FSR family fosmidomycin resistance protein-like MFS transporter